MIERQGTRDAKRQVVSRFTRVRVIRHRSLASRLRSKDSRAVLRGAVEKVLRQSRDNSLAAYHTARPVRVWDGRKFPAYTTRLAARSYAHTLSACASHALMLDATSSTQTDYHQQEDRPHQSKLWLRDG